MGFLCSRWLGALPRPRPRNGWPIRLFLFSFLFFSFLFFSFRADASDIDASVLRPRGFRFTHHWPRRLASRAYSADVVDNFH